MKKKNLKKEIKSLQGLIEEQNKLIASLTLNGTFNLPFVQQQDLCIDDGEHEYSMPWNLITLPNCQKCGKQAPDYGVIFTTSSNVSVSDSGYDWTVSNNIES
jgi:hypothetical protein